MLEPPAFSIKDQGDITLIVKEVNACFIASCGDNVVRRKRQGGQSPPSVADAHDSLVLLRVVVF